jgi:predicted RNase H-like nuclease (RuvC/YqgF family)
MKSNSIKKLALLCAALLTTTQTKPLTPAGAAGVTLGAVAGVALLGYIIHKSHHKDGKDYVHKKGEPCSVCDSKSKNNKVTDTTSEQTKKSLRSDLRKYRNDKKRYESKLKNVKSKNSAEAEEYRAKIRECDSMISELNAQMHRAG